MRSLEAENFLVEDKSPIDGHFFEYSDKSSQLKPTVNSLKAILHVSTEVGGDLQKGLKIRRLETGVVYVIKEAFVSGVGVVELDLERAKSGNDSLAIGKF
jgi:hypothetical protein